ncbi:tetratricopeptide repeat protein [Roseivirga sp.]|uniref:tetratricopeptide repeat protein n=1 Tax=Roseivirga sp. TaxID=1964215 RepID=UPI003B8CF5CB
MKHVLTIFIYFLSANSYSQDLISVATTHLNDKNYVEAKTAIDQAFEEPGISDNPRAWFMKARVYHEIFESKDPKLKPFKTNLTVLINTVVDSYNNTLSLTTRKSNLQVLAKNQIEILWANGINEGTRLFQAQKFDEAIDAFLVSKISKPTETRAFIFTALCAVYAGKYQLAVENYMAAKDLDVLSKQAYDGLIIAKRNLRVSAADLLDVVEDARFNYPDHIPYIIEEVRTLIRLQKLEEAESVLNTSVNRNPGNMELILRQADLFDIIFKSAYADGMPERSESYFEQASMNYERFLKDSPDNFTANYNYAVMINEQANRIYTRINLMSNEEYEIVGKETEEIGHDWTRKALPYMEKAWEVKPGDKKVMEALSVFYSRLKMDEKLTALNRN